MKAFEIAQLQSERERVNRPYLEFLRAPTLSAGLYVLPAGGTDPQKPHTEDEVYYVVKGRAAVWVGGENRPVQEGSVIFVPAGVPHHFHAIAEELSLLVFFAPAERLP